MLGFPSSAHRPRMAWVVGLCVLALVAIPATALAQSAGDEQYADPLAGQNEPSPDSGSDTQGGGNSGSAPSSSTPTAQGADSTAAPAPSSSSQAGIPRTGLDVTPLAVSGGALLAAGLALLWVLGPAPRRRRRREPTVLFDGTLPPLR